ncbi:MAG: 3-deoxy-manno-octulosonate cytidylyltransferase [Syntrophorhabdus sp. PtaU1.Bin058]|nr:MAG: 3-deoxy-manno-octulosonate cytidylyltransferase [Syntrophorhabdus sp. PtaU1.Bin058]
MVAVKKTIVIPARFGSTRLPGKPLLDLCGKPLIQWVHERARESRLADEILIATDDEQIRDRAQSFGAEVVMTSVACTSGTDRVYEAVRERNADIVVNLQGDEPFIRSDMIDAIFSVIEREHLDMATLCCPLKDNHEYEDPNTVKVVLDRAGYALYFSRAPIPYVRDDRRASPYKHVGIYGFSMTLLEQFVRMEKGRLEETESLEQLRVLENGYKIKVLTTQYDGFGIDTEEDLKRAEKILARYIH